MKIALILLFLLLLVYLWAIMPRMRKRPDHTFLMGHFYAHRGLHDNAGDAPENSMRAFQKAVESGYGIELDVQLTKDRIPVVFHDKTVSRVCGAEGRVQDYTYEELQQFSLFRTEEKIPKFEDVLRLVNGQVPLIIEIKIYENATIVCETADQLIGAYRGNYCIESFHPLAVRWYREHRPDVIRGQLSSAFHKAGNKEGVQEWLVHHLLTNFLCRPDFIAYDHRFKGNLSRILCRRLYGVLGVTWTVKSQAELDACENEFDLFIFEGFLP